MHCRNLAVIFHPNHSQQTPYISPSRGAMRHLLSVQSQINIPFLSMSCCRRHVLFRNVLNRAYSTSYDPRKYDMCNKMTYPYRVNVYFQRHRISKQQQNFVKNFRFGEGTWYLLWIFFFCLSIARVFWFQSLVGVLFAMNVTEMIMVATNGHLRLGHLEMWSSFLRNIATVNHIICTLNTRVKRNAF